jgi:hypothetical protein
MLGTLPLLQLVLDAVEVPVMAADGTATRQRPQRPFAAIAIAAVAIVQQ